MYIQHCTVSIYKSKCIPNVKVKHQQFSLYTMKEWNTEGCCAIGAIDVLLYLPSKGMVSHISFTMASALLIVLTMVIKTVLLTSQLYKTKNPIEFEKLKPITWI